MNFVSEGSHSEKQKVNSCPLQIILKILALYHIQIQERVRDQVPAEARSGSSQPGDRLGQLESWTASCNSPLTSMLMAAPQLFFVHMYNLFKGNVGMIFAKGKALV